MSIIYDNLSLPEFLIITVVIPILLIIYFWIKRAEYPKTFLIGILCICLMGFSVGFIRIFKENGVFTEYSHLFGAIPIPLVLLSALFIFIGAYQKVKFNDYFRSLKA